MVTALRGTYLDPITGLYMKEEEVKAEFMVVRDSIAFAIFKTQSEASKWILKSEEKDLSILEI